MILTDEEALAARAKARSVGNLCLTGIRVDCMVLIELSKTPIREFSYSDLEEMERKAAFITETLERMRGVLHDGRHTRKQVKQAYGKDA